MLFAAVIALHWAAERLSFLPSAALLLGGGALAFLPNLPKVSLDPELVLVLFLPPLLMDGAYYAAFGRLRRHLPGILSLAVGAVLFTTLVVGLVLHQLVPGLPWAACFALGAIVSPPDAVAARSVLQRVRLPRRLQALLEGESLINDATGLVLFRFAIAAALTGSFNALDAGSSFVLLAVGGVVVGTAIGFAGVFILRRLPDQTLIVATATLLSWAAYLGGEALHVSGVIPGVAAGIVFGWYQHEVLPARVRMQGAAFWRTLVFILIGFSLRGVLDRVGLERVFTSMALPVIGIVVAVLLTRFAWVFGSELLLGMLKRTGVSRVRPLGWRQATVLSWAGMRGVVTLAVALSLPNEMPGRDHVTERYAGGAGIYMPGIRAHFGIVLAAVAAGRKELIRLQRQGEIEDEVLHNLERDLDLEELGALFQGGEGADIHGPGEQA